MKDDKKLKEREDVKYSEKLKEREDVKYSEKLKDREKVKVKEEERNACVQLVQGSRRHRIAAPHHR